MKICVTSKGKNLEAEVEPKFGRCPFFIFIDTETMDYKVLENTSKTATGGAGIEAGKTVSDNEAEYVLTGNIGPNAFKTLNAANIKVVTGVKEKIKDAVDKFKAGEFNEVNSANVKQHFGMKGGE